jgi:hypothetical protein
LRRCGVKRGGGINRKKRVFLERVLFKDKLNWVYCKLYTVLAWV